MRIDKKTQTQRRKRQRHEFLLTFFELPHKYESREVNGFILVRQFNSENGEWEVAVWTKENWNKANDWKQKQKLNQAELL